MQIPRLPINPKQVSNEQRSDLLEGAAKSDAAKKGELVVKSKKPSTDPMPVNNGPEAAANSEANYSQEFANNQSESHPLLRGFDGILDNPGATDNIRQQDMLALSPDERELAMQEIQEEKKLQLQKALQLQHQQQAQPKLSSTPRPSPV